jgi:hypothetical protein
MRAQENRERSGKLSSLVSEKMAANEFHVELERIKRVSDMLVTGHARLRDRYSRRAILLDLAVMALMTWLTAVVFIEPGIFVKVTPFGVEPPVWVGFLGIFWFFLHPTSS